MIAGDLACEAIVILLLELRTLSQRAFLDRFRVQAVEITAYTALRQNLPFLVHYNRAVTMSDFQPSAVAPDRIIYIFHRL